MRRLRGNEEGWSSPQILACLGGRDGAGRQDGLAARAGRRGLALIGVGQALLTVVGADSPWWLFLPGLLVAMFGTGMFNPRSARWR
jgi:hypothetical protein